MRKYLVPITAAFILASMIQNVQADEKTQRCESYAYSAVADFHQMEEFSKCRVKPDARWQGNYKNHYRWCLTAKKEWVQSERKARDRHLLDCGARFTF